MLAEFITQAGFAFGNVLYNMNPFKKWMTEFEVDLSHISAAFDFEVRPPKNAFPGIDFSFDDEWEMEKAAKFAVSGYETLAESCRAAAGYGGLDG